MTFDHLRRQRALRRYRFMFKISLAEIALSVAAIVVGLLVAIETSNTRLMGAGLMVLGVSALSAYLTLNSTVRLLERESERSRWTHSSG